MRSTGAHKEALPEKPITFKHLMLTVTSADPGPQANPIRDRDQRRTERTPTEPAVTEWQAPRKSRRPRDLPDPPAMPLHNRFAGLLEEFMEEESA